MKNKLLSILLIIGFTSALFAQVDRSKMPEPGPAPQIQIGEVESFQLDNGLKVFVVENENLAGISVRLVIDRDPIMEGEMVGYVSTAGDLLRTGTTNRSKDQLDEEVDFIGATLSTSSTGVFGSALKKHTQKLFELIADVTLNPSFKQEELDKLKKQTMSSLASAKDNPNAIASNVRDVILYGDHPYGEVVTEETVEAITLEKCKEYYDTFFKPNVAMMAIVGNISVGDAKDLVEEYFGNWEKGDVPGFKYKTPKAPLVRKVAVVDRPASVQSVINVTYPVNLPKGHKDVIAARIANQILGGSATSRLFLNLREDKAYTYGAYSSLNSDELVGNFTASCEARTEVTDSAITEFIAEMKKIRTQKVTEEELQNVKNYLIGSFARSLESPQTVAQFALNTALYNLPEDYYTNYLKNINAVTVDDVLKAAKKYINPRKANVLVVGNASEMADNLKKFTVSGKIGYFDNYGKEYDPNMQQVPDGITAKVIFNKYIDAIGGMEKYLGLTDQVMQFAGNVQGMEIQLTITQKAPNKYHQKMGIPGMFESITIFDGENGVAMGQGQKRKLEGDQLESMKMQAHSTLYAKYEEMGIIAEVTGLEKITGKDAYKVILTLPNGTKWTQYFDVESGFIVKQITPVKTPQGEMTSTIEFSDYKEIDGMMFPHNLVQTAGPQTVSLNLVSAKINTGIDDSLFIVD